MSGEVARSIRAHSWLLSLIALIAVMSWQAANASLDQAPPNVVLIISDDHYFADFGFMGNEVVRTPHIDELASKGAVFPTAYVPSRACRPSLATLLTGLYPHQHKITFNHGPPGWNGYGNMPSRAEYEFQRSKSFNLFKRQRTLPQRLQGAGFVSFQTGKFWEGHFQNAGFTEGMTVFAPMTENRYGSNRILPNGETVALGNGDHGLQIARDGMEPIATFLRNTPEDEPWFLWFAPFLPHTPHDAPQQFQDLYNGDAVPAHLQKYYASVTQFDAAVGELIALVDQLHPNGETFFVFISDNGWLPDPENPRRYTRKSKRSPFEPGIRTPVILTWPGKIPPATHAGLVSSVDIVPTIISAVSLPADRSLPGRNLLTAVTGEDPVSENRAVFGEIYPGNGSNLGNPELDIAYRWVRRGRFKLIVPTSEDAWGQYLSIPHLFDLSKDPDETKNLASHPEHKTVFAELEHLLEQHFQFANNPNSPSH